MSEITRRFVEIADAVREPCPWTNNEWLCRPDIVAAEKPLLVRPNMAPMHCHPFHFHPHREEIIYVVYGRRSNGSVTSIESLAPVKWRTFRPAWCTRGTIPTPNRSSSSPCSHRQSCPTTWPPRLIRTMSRPPAISLRRF